LKAEVDDDVAIDEDKDNDKTTKGIEVTATPIKEPTEKSSDMASNPSNDMGAGTAKMGSGDQGPNTAGSSNGTTIGVSILIGVVGLGVIALVVSRQMRKRQALKRNSQGVEFQQVPADGEPPKASIIKNQAEDLASQEAFIP